MPFQFKEVYMDLKNRNHNQLNSKIKDSFIKKKFDFEKNCEHSIMIVLLIHDKLQLRIKLIQIML